MMKVAAIALAVCFLVLVVTQRARADETISEQATVAVKSAARGIKKGANRVSETVCTGSDVECAAIKAKNRIIEAKDSAVDGASEVKNKID